MSGNPNLAVSVGHDFVDGVCANGCGWSETKDAAGPDQPSVEGLIEERRDAVCPMFVYGRSNQEVEAALVTAQEGI